MATRAGPVGLVILAWSAVLMPALFGALVVFKATPPSLAAAVMGGAGGLSSVRWVLLLVVWCLGLPRSPRSRGGPSRRARLAVWLVFSPVPADPRMMAMLLFSALTGLLAFQALGIWTSLLAPRPIEFTAIFGNKLSLAANVVMLGNIAALFGLTLVLRAVGTSLLLRYWWTTPLLLLAAAAFFGLTLRAGTAWLVARRERMLFLIEGQG